MEGINKIKTGELVSLSEQELVDCDSDNHGCDGGSMEDAFKFIKQIGGLTSENTYPYRAKDESCDSTKVKMTSASRLILHQLHLPDSYGTITPLAVADECPSCEY